MEQRSPSCVHAESLVHFPAQRRSTWQCFWLEEPPLSHTRQSVSGFFTSTHSPVEAQVFEQMASDANVPSAFLVPEQNSPVVQSLEPPPEQPCPVPPDLSPQYAPEIISQVPPLQQAVEDSKTQSMSLLHALEQ
jgi:hypothetical protein